MPIRWGPKSRLHRTILLACSVALAGVVAACTAITAASERQPVGVVALAETIAGTSALPSNLWHRTHPEPVLLGDGDARVSWEDGRSDQLSITISRSSSPYAALGTFTLGDPTAPAAADFDSSPRSVELAVRAAADQQRAWCVVDLERGCFYWMYQARFGQYLLVVDRFDTSFPMPEAEFAGYVDGIARATEAALPRR